MANLKLEEWHWVRPQGTDPDADIDRRVDLFMGRIEQETIYGRSEIRPLIRHLKDDYGRVAGEIRDVVYGRDVQVGWLFHRSGSFDGKPVEHMVAVKVWTEKRSGKWDPFMVREEDR